MDLFFECVKQKPVVETVTLDEAIRTIFCTSMMLAVLDLYVNDKVIVRIECDSRGAGVYQFKTLMGPHIVAEVFYRPVRAQLGDTFEGPPATPLGHYVPSKDKIRVFINVLECRADDDDDLN
jgi:hypothetical protein